MESDSKSDREILRPDSYMSKPYPGYDRILEFASIFNTVLADDPDVGERLPLRTASTVVSSCSDGWMLSKLLYCWFPGTIDLSKLKKKDKEDQELEPGAKFRNNAFLLSVLPWVSMNAIRACAESLAGCHGAMAGQVIIFLFQTLLRDRLLISIQRVIWNFGIIELHTALTNDMELGEFAKSSPEEYILMWYNFHLRKAGHHE